MKKLLILIVMCIFISSCTTESNEFNCKVSTAYFGNDIPPNAPTRDYKYEYIYENEKVYKIEVSNIEGGNNTTYIYEFDTKGKPVKTIFGAGDFEEEHVFFNYASNYLEIESIRISNNIDTISRFSSKYFYVENPLDDKVYRFTDGFFKTSYKFRDNNVYEFGYYEVTENDTIDTFRQRYFYDDQPNTFYVPAYNVAILPDHINARITSKNNIIQVDNFDFDPSFSLNFIYEYDVDSRLIFYKGSPGGNIVNFEYDCN